MTPKSDRRKELRAIALRFIFAVAVLAALWLAIPPRHQRSLGVGLAVVFILSISNAWVALQIGRGGSGANSSDPLRRGTSPTRLVVLRELKDVEGSRLLTAELTPKGDVVIEGRDCGPGVDKVFGVREYEWVWTIPSISVPALVHALNGGAEDVLAAIKDRFSGERAAELGTFLEAHRIPTERWSRHGD